MHGKSIFEYIESCITSQEFIIKSRVVTIALFDKFDSLQSVKN